MEDKDTKPTMCFPLLCSVALHLKENILYFLISLYDQQHILKLLIFISNATINKAFE